MTVRPSYTVGLDLGQSQDYSALAVIEEPVWIASDDDAFALNAPSAGWVSPDALTPHLLNLARGRELGTRPAKPVLACRHLERFPLHTPYPQIVDRTIALLAAPPLAQRETLLVVDATGVGAPVVDLFAERGVTPIAVTITAGTAVTGALPEVGVPKRDLVSTIAVLLEQQRLQVAERLPEARTLRDELKRFQRTVTRNGGDSYEVPWREGAHDDLVLAVALACWLREWRSYWFDVDRSPKSYDGYTGRQIV